MNYEATLIGLLICGVIGAAVAQAKGASLRQGFAWGCVLGPVGWIIAAIILKTNASNEIAAYREIDPAVESPQAKRMREFKARKAKSKVELGIEDG